MVKAHSTGSHPNPNLLAIASPCRTFLRRQRRASKAQLIEESLISKFCIA